MKKQFELIKFILITLFILLTFMIIGMEPSTLNDDTLTEYYSLSDKGNMGWYMLWGWVWLVVSIGVVYLVEYYITKKTN